MKKICLCAYGDMYYDNDKIFDPVWMKNMPLGDSWGFFFHDLKEKLRSYGWDIQTSDMMNIDGFDKFLFFDMPSKRAKFWKKLFQSDRQRYLVQTECKPIIPENWSWSNYDYFKKIFTWNPELKGDRFIRYFWPNRLELNPAKASFEDRKKLCVLIGGNKKNRSPLELYSKRREALNWFAQINPDELDLYGVGWNMSFYKKAKESVRNIGRYSTGKEIRRIRDYPFYRGKCDSKRETLNRYKFCICYENMEGISGYITEKLFDCFSAGIVPIYMGWKNVVDYIPENTFIDVRKFDNYYQLYENLRAITEEEYKNYLHNADIFLTSDKAEKFSGKSFIEKLIDGMDIS